MSRVLSTRELGQAIGVSESSIKRWADEGVIRAARTAGGHRRIPLAEALRFVRDTRAAVLRPDILGLPALPASPTLASSGQALFEMLSAGQGDQARGLLLSLYLAGESVASIADATVAPAMERLGELWRHDPAGIFVEHRATDLCIAALHSLRTSLPPAPRGPLAIGGAVEDDPYVVPSLAAAASLAAEGFSVVNLGANTPFATFERAAEALSPALVWISASAGEDPSETLPRKLGAFARALAPVPVVAGGRALATMRLPAVGNLHHGRSMAELVAFARGLRTGPLEP